MSSDTSAKPKGLSLYANLLDTKDAAPGATISSAPVVYKQPGENNGAAVQDEAAGSASKQSISAAALRFQPTRRPQVAAQKIKSTPAKRVQASQLPANSNAGPDAQVEANGNAIEKENSGPPAPAQTKMTIADWVGDAEDDEYYFGANQRQRGGRKRRRKNKGQAPATQDWDDIYDPSRPNNYEEYKHSDERMRELREWKDRLYAHRARSTGSDSDDETRRPAMQFAPPTSSFASPPPPPAYEPMEYAPPPPPADVPNDETGEDAYARRMRLSQPTKSVAQSLPSPPSAPAGSSISRAAVRYNLPAAPAEIPATDAELEKALHNEGEMPDMPQSENESRSMLPGQKGFAQRLMAKYGWTKGTGLGANATGIITPLQGKLEKQKKRPDSEGGGFIGPGGMGKIVGGKKKGGEGEGRFGAMSDVVVLQGMVDGMDLRYELGEGNLMQEIGEECGEKYGRVERVFIDQNAANSIPVFIKFTSQLSALRAVNALEGRVFNGNTIVARFFDSEKFDSGVYR